jgi:hypothetical protein
MQKSFPYDRKKFTSKANPKAASIAANVNKSKTKLLEPKSATLRILNTMEINISPSKIIKLDIS